MISLPRLIARDRRHAAIHKAGHAVIARYLGAFFADAKIWPLEPDEVEALYTAKTWGGCTKSWFQGLRGTQAYMLAMAGAVATSSWKCDEPEDFDPYWVNLDKVSPGDWSKTDYDPEKGLDHRAALALDRLCNLFRRGGPLWGDLLKEANEPIGFWRRYHRHKAEGTLDELIEALPLLEAADDLD